MGQKGRGRMADKFVVVKKKPVAPRYKPVMVYDYTYDALNAFCAENNVKMCHLIDNMFNYCMEHLEVREEEVEA
jgi:hypothetical protein